MEKLEQKQNDSKFRTLVSLVVIDFGSKEDCCRWLCDQKEPRCFPHHFNHPLSKSRNLSAMQLASWGLHLLRPQKIGSDSDSDQEKGGIDAFCYSAPPSGMQPNMFFTLLITKFTWAFVTRYHVHKYTMSCRPTLVAILGLPFGSKKLNMRKRAWQDMASI